MKPEFKNIKWRSVYVSSSLCMSVVFAVVGMLFLIMPDGVFLLFNSISGPLGFPESPLQGFGLFQVLAAGYMYLVTVLAYFMYKYPGNAFFPILLIQGKSASSLISLILYFFHMPSLLFLTNGIVDGIIALGVLLVYRKTVSIQK